MAKIFIIADDITGSLDTAVMLSKQGIKTEVFKYDRFNKYAVSQDTGAVVVNTNSRHLTPYEARTRVGAVVEIAADLDVQIIYKKTDSALRGNIGSELAAVLDIYKGRNLTFLPAFPKMNRKTVGGIHYIDGIPVTESVFGDDPLDPVKYSSVAELINHQVENSCISIDRTMNLAEPDKDPGTIMVVDGESEEDFEKRSTELAKMRKPLLLAGCAGFAYYLAGSMDSASDNSAEEWLNAAVSKPDAAGKTFIVSGSFNKMTQRQVDKAGSMGWPVFTLPIEDGWNETTSLAEEIRAALEKNKCVILCTGKEKAEISSEEICRRLGCITSDVMERDRPLVLSVFGGDTLDAVLGELGCEKVVPIEEIETGIPISTVYCRGNEILLISKSGGFGSDDTVVNIIRYVEEKNRQ